MFTVASLEYFKNDLYKFRISRKSWGLQENFEHVRWRFQDNSNSVFENNNRDGQIISLSL